MSNTRIVPTIAFFGATGGVTNSCLVHTLRAGYKCVALVRTPEKLRQQLKDQEISDETLNNLIITSGNAIDKSAVKATLTVAGPGTLPSTIVTGLGGAPKLGGWEFCHPLRVFTIDQPTLCADAARTLIDALTEIYREQPQLASQKPSLIFGSTTGVTRGPEDVPLGMRMLYHGALQVPHEDKKNMENLYRGNVENKEGAVFRVVSGIRPTLLTGGVTVTGAKGLDCVRVGTEDKPATGFTIGRADVGHWMFQYLIHDQAGRQQWEGQMVSMTY
jgi:hypothetical protein